MKSALLVLAQFTCIVLLVFGGDWLIPWWALLLFVAGILILLWATVSLGASNLTVMPNPRAGNTLSMRGVYRFVRHPMYTAVLLCGAALAFGAPSTLRWAALSMCLIVLLLKIKHEESLLTKRYPDYPERMSGVKRLLPFLW